MASGVSAGAVAGRARCEAARGAVRAAAARLESGAAARAQLERELRAPLQAAPADADPAHELWARWRAAGDLLAALAQPDVEPVAAAAAAAALQRDLPALRDALKQLPNTWTEQGRKLTRQAAVTTPSKPAPNSKHGGGAGGGAGGGGGGGGGSGEQRNAMGAGVWKRVRLKLEGRTGEQPRRALAPHEQVVLRACVCVCVRVSARTLADADLVTCAGGARDKGSDERREPVHDVRRLDGVGVSEAAPRPAPPRPAPHHAPPAPPRARASRPARPGAAARVLVAPMSRRCRGDVAVMSRRCEADCDGTEVTSSLAPLGRAKVSRVHSSVTFSSLCNSVVAARPAAAATSPPPLPPPPPPPHPPPPHPTPQPSTPYPFL
ncbi:hypothetical protein RR46_09041 [Papilio xuthus]|uniref:Uncharacterized protein n=1 Tax=Papilio xuthus TaxID=66420 RepID=A0A194PWJ9_PAPXU|nr:hypothetical protein RR46_09041 [Papilio xuthus]